MEKNISCDAHDYFEIVCVRHSLIRVTTKTIENTMVLQQILNLLKSKNIYKLMKVLTSIKCF
jgi:transcriptional antiterminator Rof (Rho-off)